MKQSQQKITERRYFESDSTVTDEKKTLVLLQPEAKRNVDQTISTPDQYVSWYHYNTKNIEKYLQLCPHCKKPTMSAFDRIVVDSAVDYLSGKRRFVSYKTSGGNFLQNIMITLALGTVAYFILSHV